MSIFNIYKFNILSLIDYINIFFADNGILDNIFDIDTLNITRNNTDILNNYILISDDYNKLNNYKDSIYEFYKKNNTVSKDIILINLDTIIDNMISIINIYTI